MTAVKRRVCVDCQTEGITWKPVPGYEGRYEVTNTGMVRSVDFVIRDQIDRTRRQSGRLKKTWIDSGGYERVELCKDGSRSGIGVHRLVALAFNEGDGPGMEVLHLDHDKLHNHSGNLKWGTHLENVRSSIADGRYPKESHRNSRKTHCPRGHPYDSRNIRGDRLCTTCRNANQLRYNRRRRARVRSEEEV